MNAASPKQMIPTTRVPNSARPLSTTPSPGVPVAPTPPSAPTPTDNANAITGFAKIRDTNSSIVCRAIDRSDGHTIAGSPNATARITTR